MFLNNVSDSNSAIYSWQAGTSIDVLHCTMVGNIAAGSSCLRTFSGGAMTFRNGIIWGNTGGSVASGTISASYSVFQDGYVGTGNTSIDPLLDAALRPLAGSPAIDGGDTYVLLGNDPKDYDMNPRAVDDSDTVDTGVPVYGMTVDMGAFEFQVVGGGGDPCPSDSDGDLIVGIEDFLNVLANWGACP